MQVGNGEQLTKTILIIDSDLGFVFWLGQVLDQAGYQTLPAKNIADAAELLSHWGGALDMLIISPDLPESASFATHLQALHADLRVVALVEGRGTEAQAQWLERIASAFRSHTRHRVSRGA